MNMSLAQVGSQLLQLRMEFDPLDDAFRTLGTAQFPLPSMSPKWHESMQSRLAVLVSQLQNHAEVETVDGLILKQQAEDLQQKLSMKLWATFVSGYDHSPLGRVTGGIPSLSINSEEERDVFLNVIASIAPYLDAVSQGCISAAEHGRAPLSTNIQLAASRWQQLLDCKGVSLIPDGASEQFKLQVEEIFVSKVATSIRQYINLLHETILPLARGENAPGMCHIDGGLADYQKLINTHTDNFGSFNEIHQFGLTEVTRLQTSLRQLRAECGTSAEAPVASLLAATGDAQCYISAEEFMGQLHAVIEQAAENFGAVIDMSNLGKINIEEIPEHLALSSPTAYYLPGDGGSTPGKLLINAHRMVGQAKDSAMAMIYHEAIPGHHLQFEIARQSSELPFRKSAWFNAFIEGWGLYVEELAVELELYPSKNALAGKIGMELFRAARLVVDTGLHALGWSVEEAKNYLIEQAGLTPAAAANEIARYIEFPAQALSYATGKAHMLNLRKRAQQQLGQAFSLRNFHTQVLCHGTAPFSAITKLMEKSSMAMAA